MRDWWSAAELRALGNKALPGTVQNINARAERENWQRRRRDGSAQAWEYHRTSLPQPVQQQIARQAAGVTIAASPVAASSERRNLAALTGNARGRAETALLILAAFDAYIAASGEALSTAAGNFAAAWNAGEIEAEPGLRQARPHLARNTLLNWHERRRKEGGAALGGKYRGAAQAQGIEADPRLVKLLINIHAEKPWLSGPLYLEALEQNLPPGARLPSLRAVQRFLVRWKRDNPRLALQLSDPDAAKSRYQSAFGNAAAGILRLNQEWQMDASPADARCTDGRWKISVVIDVASRQARIRLTPHIKAMAHLALLRDFALERGLPERVKTDNGQDYVARAVKLAFAALEIDHALCEPFTPEGKPFVERFIGTLQHSLFPTLPGFTGHNVAEAQALRARKRFAERLGVDDDECFAVELSGAELQANIDAWLERYHARPHASLGCSPNEMAARLAAGEGRARRAVPEIRTLDICLMPLSGNAMPMITKKGIAVEGTHFIADWMGPRIGLPVLVRLDPLDMGVIHCFDPATQAYLGEGEAPERLGKNRQAVAVAAKARQRVIDREQLRAARDAKRDQAPRRLVDALSAEQINTEAALAALPQPAASPKRGAGLRHLAAVTVREAADDVLQVLQAPAAAPIDTSEPPFAEADFVAWVLAGHGSQVHRDHVIAQAQASETFALLYGIDAERIAALQAAALQGAEVRAA